MFPEASYLSALGKAVYSVAYTEWLVIDVARRLDEDIDLAAVSRCTMGPIAGRFTAAIEQSEIEPDVKRQLSAIAVEWSALVDPRNDVIHAHPATDEQDWTRLYRWHPEAEARFITDEELASVAEKAIDIAQRLAPLRDHLPE